MERSGGMSYFTVEDGSHTTTAAQPPQYPDRVHLIYILVLGHHNGLLNNKIFKEVKSYIGTHFILTLREISKTKYQTIMQHFSVSL